MSSIALKALCTGVCFRYDRTSHTFICCYTQLIHVLRVLLSHEQPNYDELSQPQPAYESDYSWGQVLARTSESLVRTIPQVPPTLVSTSDNPASGSFLRSTPLHPVNMFWRTEAGSMLFAWLAIKVPKIVPHEIYLVTDKAIRCRRSRITHIFMQGQLHRVRAQRAVHELGTDVRGRELMV